MKSVKKDRRIKHKNSDVCIAYEYPLGDKDINGALIKLKGRYPDTGRVVNQKCKELVYVIRGKGKLDIEGKILGLSVGDQVLIEPGEKYFFEGNMEMLMPCAPAWYPEQHKEIE